MLREARDLGLLPTLGATFAFRRGDRGPRVTSGNHPAGRCPPRVVAQLDAHARPARRRARRHRRRRGSPPSAPSANTPGTIAVLAYQLLKGTGRRVGEVASLHLDCLDVDEHGKDVLVYDNHKAARMGRRLPLADSGLVAAIRAQQAWVAARFPDTARQSGCGCCPARTRTTTAATTCPRTRSADLDAHLGRPHPQHRRRPARRPRRPGPLRPCRDPPARASATPTPRPWPIRAWQPSVLRDLMDHRSSSTTLGYYRVGDTRKRAAMEALARHTVDNRGITRPVHGESSQVARLNEQLSWVAVPMGKCSEPTNVRAGGQACPIRYQCAGCPHFESDPSYLPELRAYADDLRRATRGDARRRRRRLGHRRTSTANSTSSPATSAPTSSCSASLPSDERAVIQDASTTLRKARQSMPVAFGRRHRGPAVADNSAALRRARRLDSRVKRQRAGDAISALEQQR